MTRVDFHFNAPDRLQYGCRLVRKIHRSGARILVWCEDPVALAQFDSLLWTFSQLDFIPHAVASDPDHVRAASPLLLTETLQGAPHRQVLLNLGVQVPAGFEQFERLIEVVSLDDEDRALARSRWKQYTDQGYAITRHDLALKGSN